MPSRISESDYYHRRGLLTRPTSLFWAHPRIINGAWRRLSHSFKVNYARSVHWPQIYIQCRDDFLVMIVIIVGVVVLNDAPRFPLFRRRSSDSRRRSCCRLLKIPPLMNSYLMEFINGSVNFHVWRTVLGIQNFLFIIINHGSPFSKNLNAFLVKSISAPFAKCFESRSMLVGLISIWMNQKQLFNTKKSVHGWIQTKSSIRINTSLKIITKKW